MSKQDLTFSFTVDQSPDQVFAAVNDVRGWWSADLSGATDRLGAEFIFTYQDIHRSTQKITEWVPGKRVVWHVTEGYLSFVAQKDEWKGTDVVFDISRQGGKTELRFTHLGLTPEVECIEACTKGWGFFVLESLQPLITTGKGQPVRKEVKKTA